MQKYQGKCHCSRITFEFEGDLTPVIECNCSHCAIKSLLLAFIPAGQFRLLSGEGELTEYQFNKHVISHLFCRHCGVQPFGKGKDEAGTETVAVNVRTLIGIDISSLTRIPFDGKSL